MDKISSTFQAGTYVPENCATYMLRQAEKTPLQRFKILTDSRGFESESLEMVSTTEVSKEARGRDSADEGHSCL